MQFSVSNHWPWWYEYQCGRRQRLRLGVTRRKRHASCSSLVHSFADWLLPGGIPALGYPRRRLNWVANCVGGAIVSRHSPRTEYDMSSTTPSRSYCWKIHVRLCTFIMQRIDVGKALSQCCHFLSSRGLRCPPPIWPRCFAGSCTTRELMCLIATIHSRCYIIRYGRTIFVHHTYG